MTEQNKIYIEKRTLEGEEDHYLVKHGDDLVYTNIKKFNLHYISPGQYTKKKLDKYVTTYSIKPLYVYDEIIPKHLEGVSFVGYEILEQAEEAVLAYRKQLEDQEVKTERIDV